LSPEVILGREVDTAWKEICSEQKLWGPHFASRADI